MLNIWYIKWGFWLLAIADILFLQLVFSISRERYNDRQLTQYKYLMLFSIVALIFAASALGLVYANVIWIHRIWPWLIPFAVIGNATSKIVSAIMFQALRKYKYKEPE